MKRIMSQYKVVKMNLKKLEITRIDMMRALFSKCVLSVIIVYVGSVGVYTLYNREKLAKEFSKDYGFGDITATLCYRLIVNVIGSVLVFPVGIAHQLAIGCKHGGKLIIDELAWIPEFIQKIFDTNWLKMIWNNIAHYGLILGRFITPWFQLLVRYSIYTSPLSVYLGIRYYHNFVLKLALILKHIPPSM
uniref:Uncharacterized protein n=1 Tax=Marseillevirus LCMAC202 TaxID=2506606 RepID=A0A481YZD6_9VIRU|nr:MAG: hypothetical protein LCMAC202_05390 [Marseillevirus LCMAC202]